MKKLVKITAYQQTERLFLIEENASVQDKIEQWNKEVPIMASQVQELDEFEFSPNEPHIGMEWSDRYIGQGSDWDDNRESELVYIPRRLCYLVGTADAFAVYTGINPVHIISEDIGGVFDSEGEDLDLG